MATLFYNEGREGRGLRVPTTFGRVKTGQSGTMSRKKTHPKRRNLKSRKCGRNERLAGRHVISGDTEMMEACPLKRCLLSFATA
jgi:hypothetical protein